MADDLSKRGTPDRSRINLSEAYEARYWTEALGVSVRAVKRDWTMAKLWLARELKRSRRREWG